MSVHNTTELNLMIFTLFFLGKRQSVNLEKFINACDFEDNTPLHLACKKGHEATVEVCLRHGADVEARNDMASNTPLHVAAQAGQVSVVEILIGCGANVAAVNALQRTPMHL
jgi:ankyrin repeat protein